MLYTVISLAEVFYNEEQCSYETQSVASGYLTVKNSPDGSVVERLISTDPFEYLKTEFSPGTEYKRSFR